MFITGKEPFEDSTLMEESEEQQNIDNDASNDSSGHHEVNTCLRKRSTKEILHLNSSYKNNFVVIH